MPLAIRWSLSISALIVLVMGLLGWFLIGQQKQGYREQIDLLGQVIIDQFARAASEPFMADDQLLLEVLVKQQEKNPLILGMQLIDLDGHTVVSAGEVPAPAARPRAGEQARLSADRHAITYARPIEFQQTRAGQALVTIDRRPLEQNLRRLVNALLTTTLGLIVLGALLSVALAHRLCRPIHRLVAVGEAIDRGDTRPLPPGSGRQDEIGRVLNAFRHLAEGLEEKRHVERTLSRYLSPEVAQKVLSDGDGDTLGGALVEGSVLFCDIVGFTELSEALEPGEVVQLLNDYFSYFALAGSSCQGTVDKFIGDCIMILFGVPEQDSNHAFHALTCALLIQNIAREINRKRSGRNLRPVLFRIGIGSGAMLAGNLGSEQRMQYTVIGDTVNLASRICGLAEPGGILLTEEVAQQPGMAAVTRPCASGPVRVRGRRQPVVPYEIDESCFTDGRVIQRSLEIILSGSPRAV